MRDSRWFVAAVATVALFAALVSASVDHDAPAVVAEGWYRNRHAAGAIAALATERANQPRDAANAQSGRGTAVAAIRDFLEGRRLFDQETFGGNGRTCLTCHSEETGTVSAGRRAPARFRINRHDPLFVHDGSDDDDEDGFGDGTTCDAHADGRDDSHAHRAPSERRRSNTIPTRAFVTVRRGDPDDRQHAGPGSGAHAGWRATDARLAGTWRDSRITRRRRGRCGRGSSS